MLGLTRQQLEKADCFCSAKALLLTHVRCLPWWSSLLFLPSGSHCIRPLSYQSLTITPEQCACIAVCRSHTKHFGILRDEKHHTNVRYCQYNLFFHLLKARQLVRKSISTQQLRASLGLNIPLVCLLCRIRDERHMQAQWD